MYGLCIEPGARDPERRCFRADRIEVGTDLLGNWLVDVTYGRIGPTAEPWFVAESERPTSNEARRRTASAAAGAIPARSSKNQLC